jgi:hypothetical protein
VEIEEVQHAIGLQTNILYFTLPNEDFPALVRRVTFKNIEKNPLQLEVGLLTTAFMSFHPMYIHIYTG